MTQTKKKGGWFGHINEKNLYAGKKSENWEELNQATSISFGSLVWISLRKQVERRLIFLNIIDSLFKQKNMTDLFP